MMKKNVLVFPCGSEIGLELHRSLEFSTHFNLIGGSSTDDHGKYVYKNYIGDMPFIDDELFIVKLNQLIKELNIDFIFPAHDSVVLKIAEAKREGRLECDVVTSPFETCQIARSKKMTYQFLKDVVPVPRSYNSEDITISDFPIFLKPDVGQGSKGTYKALNADDIAFYTEKDNSLLLLEYLPGKEYTVDCFTDANRTLLFNEARERSRVSGGISVSSEVVYDPRFEDLARKINDNIVFNGVWFFQVKEDKNKNLVLMEIAPRIAGTMALARSKGVNLALMSLFNAIGQKVEIIENNYEMNIDRALQNTYKHNINYEHVYVDLDDTLIINNEVNVQLVAFLFQCINKKIQIHLITKHKEVLESTLINHKLTNIFDEVVVIKDEMKKTDFIINRNSIFIDDSFAERKLVYSELGIPVFDPHAVESLMEK